jgi:lipopolysaccharide export system permease protein
VQFLFVKKLHILVLKSWIGPFLIAFSVILFVLVLQFLSKYLDEIAGKDVGSDVLGKVFLYTCMSLVPLALPLAVLLSSLLTMGNLGESYELAAMRSSGIGLFRIMRPLTFATILVASGSLYFSFFLMPAGNLKLYTLLFDLGNTKASFALKEKHFYPGIDNMVIHVDEIDREKDILYGIKIFDHSTAIGNRNITIAESGFMKPNKDLGVLSLTLFNGVSHQEMMDQAGQKKKDPYQRFYFDTLRYEVQLEGFKMEETDENTFVSHNFMMDIDELYVAVDSMTKKFGKHAVDMQDYISKYLHVDTLPRAGDLVPTGPDTVTYAPNGPVAVDEAKSVAFWFPSIPVPELLDRSVQHARAVKNYTKIVRERVDNEAEKLRKYRIEIHVRWMLPFSCMVFLFLGAPLGAIIRKGGIGVPVLVSILFFILFYILMIQGRKLARDGFMEVWIGVWLPVLVMFPMALVVSRQAQTDSPLLMAQSWYRTRRRLFGWIPFLKKKKSLAEERQTMTIAQLIELRERQKRDAKKAIEDYESNKD